MEILRASPVVKQLGKPSQFGLVQSDIFYSRQALQSFNIVCSDGPVLSLLLTARLYPGLQGDLAVLPVLIHALGSSQER